MRHRKNFTLVEIMIVVAIIGLLAAIAVPSFMQARSSAQENACMNNQRQINGAIQQYMLQEGDNDPALSDAAAYIDGEIPECPVAGTYNFDTNSEDKTSCSEHGQPGTS